jgi:hypothetical protein
MHGGRVVAQGCISDLVVESPEFRLMLASQRNEAAEATDTLEKVNAA